MDLREIEYEDLERAGCYGTTKDYEDNPERSEDTFDVLCSFCATTQESDSASDINFRYGWRKSPEGFACEDCVKAFLADNAGVARSNHLG